MARVYVSAETAGTPPELLRGCLKRVRLSLKCNSGGRWRSRSFCIANPTTLILSYLLLRGWGSKIYAEGLFKHPLRRVDLGSIPMKVNLLPKRRRLQGSLDSEYPRKSHATLIPLMVII